MLTLSREIRARRHTEGILQQLADLGVSHRAGGRCARFGRVVEIPDLQCARDVAAVSSEEAQGVAAANPSDDEHVVVLIALG